jgi:polyisoprenoid-binding protein YceI
MTRTDYPARPGKALISAALLLTIAAGANAAGWPRSDFALPEISVEFRVAVLGIFAVTGRFRDVRASFLELADGASAGLNITVCPYSLHTGDPQRDQLLRSSLFFDVDRFPAIRFRNVRVLRTQDGLHRLKGLMTLNTVTRPVVFTVLPPEHRLAGDTRMPVGHKARTSISRSDFGLDAFPLLVSDEVEITVHIDGDPSELAAGLHRLSSDDSRISALER